MMYIASKVWKKIVLIFLYTLYKARKKVIFIFIPGYFSFISNAMNFLIHSLNRFDLKKKCLCNAGFSQLGALYAIITHDPKSECNGRKLSVVSSVNRAGGSGGVLRPQWGP